MTGGRNGEILGGGKNGARRARRERLPEKSEKARVRGREGVEVTFERRKHGQGRRLVPLANPQLGGDACFNSGKSDTLFSVFGVRENELCYCDSVIVRLKEMARGLSEFL